VVEVCLGLGAHLGRPSATASVTMLSYRTHWPPKPSSRVIKGKRYRLSFSRPRLPTLVYLFFLVVGRIRSLPVIGRIKSEGEA
jgi:hypothetical protein